MLGAACSWPLLAVVSLCLLLARLLLFSGVCVAAAFLTSKEKTQYSFKILGTTTGITPFRKKKKHRPNMD